MSKWIRRFFAGVIGFLLLFLGIEKRKNKKQAEKILDQKEQIIHEQKQTQIYKVAHETVVQAVKQEQVIEEKQKQQEAKIEEAKTDDEVIAIANDIVSDFNARN